MKHDTAQIVYLVDDDESIRRSLTRLLNSWGYQVSSHASAKQFLATCHAGMSGCVVLDLNMPEMSGLDVQRAMASTGIHLPVIFLSGQGNIPTSVSAMKAGAEDFLTKPVKGAEVLDAITRAMARDVQQRERRAEAEAFARRIARLTPREREVLRHVVQGFLNKQIAAALGTVEKTVKVHRARVMAKLEVESVAELVRIVERSGLFGDSDLPKHPQ